MGLVQGLFGGSKQSSSSTGTSQSSNRAFDMLSSAFGPLTGAAGTGIGGLQALLGGDATGFNNFKDATGFDFAADQGSRGITGNAAASGLLRSGSTGKSLVNFGNNIQNQFANNYMDRMLGLADAGFKAGGLISGAGGVSNSTNTSKSSGSNKPGIGGFLGKLATGVATGGLG